MKTTRCIGIDIGGTKIRAVLWDGARVVRASESRTPKSIADFWVTVVWLVWTVSRWKPVRAVAVGAAGVVKETTLEFSPNIPFIHDFDFRRLWPRSVRLRVDNDARCFARAELLKGAARRAESLFALTIGTGVGRAYGRDGKIAKLKEFEYPELWEENYQRVRQRRDDRKLADFLGRRLVPLVASLRPKVIVVGGGVMTRRGLLRRLQKSFKVQGLGANVRRARFGKNAVAVGAALLFKD